MRAFDIVHVISYYRARGLSLCAEYLVGIIALCWESNKTI